MYKKKGKHFLRATVFQDLGQVLAHVTVQLFAHCIQKQTETQVNEVTCKAIQLASGSVEILAQIDQNS